MSGRPTPAAAPPTEALLVRALGVRQLAASIFNYTVGSGIFALPALAVARLGSAAPLAYVACAFAMGCIVLCFAEAGSRVALTGGAYAYVEVALGPAVGLVAGVLLFVTGVTAGAAVVVLFAKSVSALAPAISPRWLPATLIIAVTAFMAFINVRGVHGSARLIECMTVAKLLPLVAFVIIGAAFIHRENLRISAAPSVSEVLGTAGIVIFAFSGIESALTPSGEVHAPARTVPRASFLALGAATALYLAIQWVALGIRGGLLGRNDTTPLADAAAVFAGSLGRTVMIVGASISMFGYLSGNMLAVPRSLFALGRDGFLPRVLSHVHLRHRTPYVAILVYAALVIALALSGTFVRLALLSNLAALVLYILSAIGAWLLRRRDVRTDEPPYLMPGGPLIPAAACVTNALLIYETAGWRELAGLLLVCALTLALYVLKRRQGASHLP